MSANIVSPPCSSVTAAALSCIITSFNDFSWSRRSTSMPALSHTDATFLSSMSAMISAQASLQHPLHGCQQPSLRGRSRHKRLPRARPMDWAATITYDDPLLRAASIRPEACVRIGVHAPLIHVLPILPGPSAAAPNSNFQSLRKPNR